MVIKALSSPAERRITFTFLTVFAIALSVALVIGLDGNTTANVFALLSANALVLAFVHPWRQISLFRNLLLGSIVGFAGLALLHNLFAAGAMSTSGVLRIVLESLSIAAFLSAVYLCPPALVIGIAGMLIIYAKGKLDSGSGS